MLQAKQIEAEYRKLVNAGAVKENSITISHLKWKKAVNDLALAEGLIKISTLPKLKDLLNYSFETSFFDWAIVCSYFSIFHATQALLGLKKVKIDTRLHYATLIAFAKQFIINGELESHLFYIYENAENKAKELLEIFEEEKKKRSLFQYHRLSKNNLQPAKESLNNAKSFLEAIQEILKKKNII